MVAAGRDFGELLLGYYDYPPAAWWLAWGAQHLTGTRAALVVRLPFIVLFGISTWLMYRLQPPSTPHARASGRRSR